MDKKTKAFFWVVCLLAVISALYWSVASYIGRAMPLYLAFTVVNFVSLITVCTCFIIDVVKSKGQE